MKSAFWRAMIFLWLTLSALLSAWGFWPATRQVAEIPLQVPDPEWALPEARILRLEFSPSPRSGDSQIIELRVAVADAIQAGANIYNEYTVIAEARLDMPLAEVRPAGTVSAPLAEGGGATFYWEIDPRVGSGMDGTVWTYLRFIPHDGGAEIRQILAAQMLSIRPRSVFGRDGSEARLWGVVGLVAGIFLGWLSFWAGKPARGA